MTYRITIDRTLCSGFGTCAQLAPELVEVDDAGLALARVGVTDDGRAPELAAACPMAAIAVEEAA